MDKCPKCGGEDIWALRCYDCGYTDPTRDPAWDEGWDMCEGVPVYNFYVVWYPDYPKEDPSATLWVAVGEHLCVTPPVIPPGELPHYLQSDEEKEDEEEMKAWARLAKKASKGWQKENPYEE